MKMKKFLKQCCILSLLAFCAAPPVIAMTSREEEGILGYHARDVAITHVSMLPLSQVDDDTAKYVSGLAKQNGFSYNPAVHLNLPNGGYIEATYDRGAEVYLHPDQYIYPGEYVAMYRVRFYALGERPFDPINDSKINGLLGGSTLYYDAYNPGSRTALMGGVLFHHVPHQAFRDIPYWVPAEKRVAPMGSDIKSNHLRLVLKHFKEGTYPSGYSSLLIVGEEMPSTNDASTSTAAAK